MSPMRTITLAKLAEYGFAEDHNLQVQVHFGSGESLPELAQELVTARPDVIVAISRSAILAARRGLRRSLAGLGNVLNFRLGV